MNQTKEKIMQTALHLFARDGYEAVSVSAIAGELGMTKGALYKHYANKRAIFDSIVERMHEIDARRSQEFSVPQEAYAAAPAAYEAVSAEAVRAEADAQKAEAEAESVRMDNAEHATRILMDSIVKPLKDELDETRRDMQSLKRAMLRLRKSIDAAKGCRYSDGCPVLDELQKQQDLDDRTGRTDSAAAPAAERQRAGPHNLPAGRC